MSASRNLMIEIFDISSEMMCLIGADGVFRQANNAFVEGVKGDKEALATVSFMNFIHPDDLEDTKATFHNLISGASVPPFQNRYRLPDGAYVWLEWSMTFITNEALLFAVVRNITENKRDQAAISENNAMLSTVSVALADFISENSTSNPFNTLLSQLLHLTHSEFGFIGEVLHDENGAPYLKTHSLTNIAWDEESRLIHDRSVSRGGMEFRNLNTLFGRVLSTGKPLISNNPAKDPFSGGIPKGHPVMNSFLGMPIYSGTQFIGMLGIANRKSGYQEELMEYLSLFLSTCSNLILAYRAEQQKQVALQQLQRAKQLAEAANIEKSHFLANMSHEIRTPLNGVMGMIDLSLTASIDLTQREYLETAMFSANTLHYLINDLLDFSKIEAGKLEFESVAFRIRDHVEFCVQHFRIDAATKGIRILMQMDDGIPELIIGDPHRVRQVLLNLIGNAVKFTQFGTVSIDVSATVKSHDECTLMFSVRDTGIGIPADKQALIFNSFEQADSSITRKFGGTGLGLSISQALVRKMGGHIKFESVEAEGSHFWFELSFALDVDAPTLVESRTTRKHPENMAHVVKPIAWRPLNVLLVEDNIVNQKIYEQILHQRGHRVSIADNGLNAVSAFENHAYDVILMDLQMPVMGGLEACRLIRGKEKLGLPRSVIVALTAHAMSGDSELCREAGMDAYLAKPIQKHELFQAIEDRQTANP